MEKRNIAIIVIVVLFIIGCCLAIEGTYLEAGIYISIFSFVNLGLLILNPSLLA
jgi:hypothetical protein